MNARILFKRSESAYDCIIACLGNPGREYEFTRHNTGFLFSAVLEDNFPVKPSKLKFHALCRDIDIDGHRCLLMRPQTYMNNSGEAVREAADFYKIPPQNIIVVFDDISLPVGKLRVRRNGSAGGHNGIKNIIEHLSSTDFPRIKIGVGAKPDPEYDLADWVLSRFTDDELKTLRTAVDTGIEGLRYILDGKMDRAMNICN